jgi:photosystem I P700 chlorophyll a apoprotein A1
MHLSWPSKFYLNKSTKLSSPQLLTLAGLGSLAFSGHLFHLSININCLLESGIDASSISSVAEFLTRTQYVDLSLHLIGQNKLFDYRTGTISIELMCEHHLFLGVALLIGGLVCNYRNTSPTVTSSVNKALSQNLMFVGLSSLWFSVLQVNVPIYSTGCDIGTTISLLAHHLWIGSLFIVGSGAHYSIYLIRATNFSVYEQQILTHRDVILSHLSWVCVWLGFHAFGLYIHNDVL